MHHRCHTTGLQGWPYFYGEMKFTVFYICHTRRPFQLITWRNVQLEWFKTGMICSRAESLLSDPRGGLQQQQRVEVGELVNTCWSSIQNRHFRSGILESIPLQWGKLFFCVSLVCIFLGWTLIASQCFELPIQILWIFLCISSLLLWESRGHGSDSFIYFCKSLSSGVAVTSFIFLLGLTGFTTECFGFLLFNVIRLHHVDASWHKTIDNRNNAQVP